MKLLNITLLLCLTFSTACAKIVRPSTPEKWHAIRVGGKYGQNDSGLKALEQELPALAKLNINTIILGVGYNFEFKSHPELRQSKSPITHAGARNFAKACRQYSIRLIPEFDCLGHQSWKQNTLPLLKVYPELDLTPGAFPNNEDIYCREWDPYNPKVNKIVFKLIDELIDAFQADAFHVGMDEVFLLGHEKSPSTKGKDPSVVFAKAVNDLYSHVVKKHKIEMLMWADRLIDGNKFKMGKWQASIDGTHKAADMISKEIIVCPWHYNPHPNRDFPSIPMLLEKGFRVLPCSFKNLEAQKQLINYANKYNGPRMLGHCITCWGETYRKEFKLSTAKPIIEGSKLLEREN